MSALSRFDRKSNSSRSIAAQPCEESKDGAPPGGMLHAKIVKGGPPVHEAFALWRRNLAGSLSFFYKD
jgi:hypothetical protein